MTRKHKPQNAHKKRPLTQNSRPVKAAAADKTIAAVAGVREKDRSKHVALLARKATAGVGARVAAGPNAKGNDSARVAEAKGAGGRVNAGKGPLGLERRGPGMPQERTCPR